MLKLGEIEIDRTLIIGDFNLEPWDNILRHPEYINSSFIKVHNDLNLLRNSKAFFNPISNLIHKSVEIGGTYFSKRSGWALFDYCLYNTNKMKVDFNIVQGLMGSSLLSDKYTLKNPKDAIDHLPILTTVLN